MNPRVRAVVRKEVREFRRNRFVIGSMIVLPIIFLLVPILSTTLRALGTPDELRAQMFPSALEVVTAEPVANPDALFSPIAHVAAWRARAPGEYELALDGEPGTVAPDVARTLVAAGAELVRLAEARHSLEDVYLGLIHDDVEAES